MIFLNKYVFLAKKKWGFRKMITEKDIARQLQDGGITLIPLKFQALPRQQEAARSRVDAIIRVSWAKLREKFAVEYKALSTPKIIREAMYRAKAAARDISLLPMIIVPYLNEEFLRELERESISGVDLCGNGIVVAPGKFSVYRTGNPNRFPSSAPIKNIYRRNSSMVGRLFLVQPRFDLVTEILDEINRRNPLANWERKPTSLSTISKALKGLEGDMIIGREGSTARLLQAEMLLNKLVENYTRPRIVNVINWKIPTPSSGLLTINDALSDAFKSETPAVVAGASSVSVYAVMGTAGPISIYCPNPEGWLRLVPGSRTDRFSSISVMQTEDALVYFDARREKGTVWASPIQTYLELMVGDKRDQETALQIKDLILRRLKEGLP